MGSMVSILFGTVDRTKSVYRLVESIEKYTPPVKYEIIIVDGGKPLEIQKFAMARKDMQYFQDTERAGYSKAYNKGARLAKGDYIVWLNDDCEVTPNWALKVVDFMNKHPLVGVGGIPFNEGGKKNIRQKILGRYIANFGCIRTNLWNQLKGFDEQYRSYAAETDMCFKVMNAGYHVVPVPNVIITHFRVWDDNHRDMQKKDRAGSFSLFMSKWQAKSKQFNFKERQ